MQYTGKKLAGAVLLGALWAGSASGAIIAPNDDTYVRASSSARGINYDMPGGSGAGGLLMKNQTGDQYVTLIEYTIPNTAVTSATFNATYFRSWASNVAWSFRLQGVVASFDESTLTYNTGYSGSALQNGPFTVLTGADIAMPGGTTGVGNQDLDPPILITVDITSFFNANLGQTVSFRCASTTSSSIGNAGGSFEDRELSRTGNANYAPFLAYTPVPEPASALLVLGALPLIRRRRA